MAITTPTYKKLIDESTIDKESTTEMAWTQKKVPCTKDLKKNISLHKNSKKVKISYIHLIKPASRNLFQKNVKEIHSWKTRQVIEVQDHPFKPTITNHILVDTAERKLS